MKSMESNWNIRTWSEDEQALVQQLAAELKISVVSASLLVARSIRTADEARTYIRPSLDQLHDPLLFRDMDKALNRLKSAISSGEKILVYGDYDVDGTTAVALFYTFMQRVLSQASGSDNADRLDYYIPDRYTEGYGISYQGIDYAQANGFTLIVALDCGIKAADKVLYARERGIDFIICDHHTPGDTIPDAVAVLDAERADNTYPYDKLSGCGVGFKLAQAYCESEGLDKNEYLYPLLPMLAMSIASDIVPMTGENRLLEYYGIRQLNTQPPVGVRAIMEVAGIADKPVTMTDLLFKIGPRINACGRLYSGREAVKLLITDDPDFAQQQAKDVDSFNQERKNYDSTTTDEALEILRQDPDYENKHTTVVYRPTWHKGVVGISASRLTEIHYRPTIVLTAGNDGIISGSARSVGGFDIYQAIDSCRDLLTNFGGHAFAAGLSMAEKDLEEFKRRFEEYVAAHILPEQQQPTIDVENQVLLSDITPQMYNVMRCLEPFGPENPRPVFVTRGLTNARFTKRVGEMGKHLKLHITDGTVEMNGIGFGLGEWAPYLQQGGSVDVCYEIEPNTWGGKTTLQMVVRDIKQAQ